MTNVIRDTQAMLAGMSPVLQPGEYIFCSTSDPAVIANASGKALSSFREQEGATIVLDIGSASSLGFDTGTPMRHIVLKVFSALDGVGLTAAVASALAVENIPCNIVAAYHHDHVFVPSTLAARAVSILQAVQQQAAV